MQDLLTVMAIWLSVNFGLPASDEKPRIEFVSAARMAEVRRERLAAERSHGVVEIGQGTSPDTGHEFHAIYDDVSRTIYLPSDWTPASSAHVSMLLHEMVHHLQNAGALKYECSEARERPAYQAQARWLELFGKKLEEEFKIDPMTILVRTSCMY